MKLTELKFTSAGLQLSARLFLPEDTARPPVVVMAHGFAAEQTFRLPAFAEKFVERGLATLSFDYRNFGGSQGQPRNLVDPGRHLEDWRAAIAFARGLDQVDGSRLALWGSSFSGGHVLVTAARDPQIRAVVAQVPFVDGIATAKILSLRYTLTGLYHGALDLMASLTGGVHYVPVVADPSEFGLMNTPESKPGYLALVPPDSTWKNQAPGRIVFSLPAYRPIKHAAQIVCPTLIVLAENDSLIPAAAVRKCAARIKDVRLESLPVGHFDVYSGDNFERVAGMEAEFLTKHLTGMGLSKK
jgi:dienelactone hydrolase